MRSTQDAYCYVFSQQLFVSLAPELSDVRLSDHTVNVWACPTVRTDDEFTSLEASHRDPPGSRVRTGPRADGIFCLAPYQSSRPLRRAPVHVSRLTRRSSTTLR